MPPHLLSPAVARSSETTTSDLVRLADLPPGTRSTVVAIDGETPAATARRLADLGFTAGVVVEVVRRAPLRDPVIYRLRDYEICLRRAQAQCVLTSPVR